jgi:four helix bundle protein
VEVDDIQGYRKLEVFNAAYELSLELHRMTRERFPHHEQTELGSQIRRASKSIALNIAEGYGKRSLSKREFAKYLFIAMGSADELAVELEFCRDLGYVSKEEYEVLADRVNKIGRQIRHAGKATNRIPTMIERFERRATSDELREW